MDVEPPEVDQLAGGVDLGLLDGFALAQDGRRVDPVAPGPGEQLGGTEEDRGTLLEGGVRPVPAGHEGGVDGALHIRHRRLVEVPQLLGVPVRCAHREAGAGALDWQSADVHRQGPG